MAKGISVEDVRTLMARHRELSTRCNFQVLSPWHRPRRILHRDRQLRNLCMHIASALEMDLNATILVHGAPGTGKTCCIDMVASAVEDAETVYINCNDFSTPRRVLFQILSAIDDDMADLVGGPNTNITGLFMKTVRGKKLLVILDEVDRLFAGAYNRSVANDLFYTLTRFNHANIIIVGIANDTSFKTRLDPRVFSTLSEREVYFPPYSMEEMRDILLERLRDGFGGDVLPLETVDYVASRVWQDGGDLRICLNVFARLAESLAQNDEPIITLKMAREAYKAITGNALNDLLNRLSVHQAAVLLATIRAYQDVSGRSKNADLESILDEYHLICEDAGVSPLDIERLGPIFSYFKQQGLVATRHDSHKPGIISMARIVNPAVFEAENLLEEVITGGGYQKIPEVSASVEEPPPTTPTVVKKKDKEGKKADQGPAPNQGDDGDQQDPAGGSVGGMLLSLLEAEEKIAKKKPGVKPALGEPGRRSKENEIRAWLLEQAGDKKRINATKTETWEACPVKGKDYPSFSKAVEKAGIIFKRAKPGPKPKRSRKEQVESQGEQAKSRGEEPAQGPADDLEERVKEFLVQDRRRVVLPPRAVLNGMGITVSPYRERVVRKVVSSLVGGMDIEEVGERLNTKRVTVKDGWVKCNGSSYTGIDRCRKCRRLVGMDLDGLNGTLVCGPPEVVA
jgi:cell division control protein 6